MKQEEGLIRADVLQNQGGHLPPPQQRRYADNHARILRIVDDCATGEGLTTFEVSPITLISENTSKFF